MCSPAISSPGSVAARTYAWRARSRSRPNLVSFLPVAMYLWVLGSTSGFTRKAMRAARPTWRAHSEIRSASGSDSTVKMKIFSSSAYSISSRVLPTPAKTMRFALAPALSARKSSPPETMSKPAPRSASVWMTAALEFALTE